MKKNILVVLAFVFMTILFSSGEQCLNSELFQTRCANFEQYDQCINYMGTPTWIRQGSCAYGEVCFPSEYNSQSSSYDSNLQSFSSFFPFIGGCVSQANLPPEVKCVNVYERICENFLNHKTCEGYHGVKVWVPGSCNYGSVCETSPVTLRGSCIFCSSLGNTCPSTTSILCNPEGTNSFIRCDNFNGCLRWNPLNTGTCQSRQQVCSDGECVTYCAPRCSCTLWVNTESECNSIGQKTITSTRTCTPICGGSCSTQLTSTTTIQSCTYLDVPYFATLSSPNTKITSTNLGDTVLLRFPGANLEGKVITYYVETSTGSLWSRILGLFGGTPWSSLPRIDGKAYQDFQVSQTKLHRINASILSENLWKLSSSLTVGSASNSLPDAIILNPPAGTQTTFYRNSTGVAVMFTQRSVDEDDLLKIFWDFGDRTNRTIQNYSKSLNLTKADTTKTYSVGARFYTITLNAKEMTRTQEDTSSVQIYIFQPGINIVPIIASPLINSVQGYMVNFNASQSYIVNCSVGMTPSDFTVGNLKCKYILAPGAQQPSSGNVKIRWKEIDSEGEVIRWIRGNETEGVAWNSANYGDMFTNLNGVVVFPYFFDSVQFRRIRMEMSYSP